MNPVPTRRVGPDPTKAMKLGAHREKKRNFRNEPTRAANARHRTSRFLQLRLRLLLIAAIIEPYAGTCSNSMSSSPRVDA